MYASDSDSLRCASSDYGSDFEGFTAADIRESERSVSASVTQQTSSVAVGAVNTSANSRAPITA